VSRREPSGIAGTETATGENGEVRTYDVAEILRRAGVDATRYSLTSGSHEGLCLLNEGRLWNVFLSERGSRHEVHSFEDEDSACVYFLKRIFEISSPG